jgi:hypothetical protein
VSAGYTYCAHCTSPGFLNLLPHWTPGYLACTKHYTWSCPGSFLPVSAVFSLTSLAPSSINLWHIGCHGIQEPSFLATHLIQDAGHYKKPLKLVSSRIGKAFNRVVHYIILQSHRALGVPEIMIIEIQHYTITGFLMWKLWMKKPHYNRQQSRGSPINHFIPQCHGTPGPSSGNSIPGTCAQCRWKSHWCP